MAFGHKVREHIEIINDQNKRKNIIIIFLFIVEKKID